MTVSEIMRKMIAHSSGNLHDINHFIKVWTYAKTIGELEGLPPETLFILEAAAIVHDIACPLCREKYGNTDGKLQERESAPLVEAFFKNSGLSEQQAARISYLVSHHHTLTDINGVDYQILIEADYIVNAGESGYPPENIRNACGRIFKTRAGTALLKSIYSF